MSAKKVTEHQPRYSVQTDHPAKARVSHKPVGKAAQARSVDLVDTLDELKKDLLAVKTEIKKVNRRLAAFESQLTQLGKAQPLPASTAKLKQGLSKADLTWLSLAEPSFAFWDNEEDAVYDTL